MVLQNTQTDPQVKVINSVKKIGLDRPKMSDMYLDMTGRLFVISFQYLAIEIHVEEIHNFTC